VHVDMEGEKEIKTERNFFVDSSFLKDLKSKTSKGKSAERQSETSGFSLLELYGTPATADDNSKSEVESAESSSKLIENETNSVEKAVKKKKKKRKLPLKFGYSKFFFQNDDQRLQDGVGFFSEPVDLNDLQWRWPEERTRLKEYISSLVKNVTRKNKKRIATRRHANFKKMNSVKKTRTRTKKKS